MMPRFPDWLTEDIAARAKKLLDEARLSKESAARLDRLCCDPEMENVWRDLGNAAPGGKAAL